MFDFPQDQLQDFAHVVTAALLAGLVGLEREASDKPAGFRTHMLIGGASALLVILGTTLIDSFEDSTAGTYLRTDPIRIIEAIIVGISFIGAGTILKVPSEQKIRYLTTAASIFFSAGIGISVALKQYYLAVGITVSIVVINLGMEFVDRWLARTNLSDTDTS